jgi:hypothetical protein
MRPNTIPSLAQKLSSPALKTRRQRARVNGRILPIGFTFEVDPEKGLVIMHNGRIVTVLGDGQDE